MFAYLIMRLWQRALQTRLQCSEEENWRVIEEGRLDGAGGGSGDDGSGEVKIISTEFDRGA